MNTPKHCAALFFALAVAPTAQALATPAEIHATDLGAVNPALDAALRTWVRATPRLATEGPELGERIDALLELGPRVVPTVMTHFRDSGCVHPGSAVEAEFLAALALNHRTTPEQRQHIVSILRDAAKAAQAAVRVNRGPILLDTGSRNQTFDASAREPGPFAQSELHHEAACAEVALSAAAEIEARDARPELHVPRRPKVELRDPRASCDAMVFPGELSPQLDALTRAQSSSRIVVCMEPGRYEGTVALRRAGVVLMAETTEPTIVTGEVTVSAPKVGLHGLTFEAPVQVTANARDAVLARSLFEAGVRSQTTEVFLSGNTGHVELPHGTVVGSYLPARLRVARLSVRAQLRARMEDPSERPEGRAPTK